MRIWGLPVWVLFCALAAFSVKAEAANLVYGGGPVIRVAKVVYIFWGPSFSNPASPDFQYAQTLVNFRNQFGTNGEYNIITQYYQIIGGAKQFIQPSNLAAGTADEFDSSAPPTNVTDSAARAEIQHYLATHAADASTIYELVLPSTSYSSSGGSTSCGGPNVAYCTYQSTLSGGGLAGVHYAVQPYDSCSACQVAGWTAVQNQERLVGESTRKVVVNPLSNAWHDPSGNTGEDLCLWSPAPFLEAGTAIPTTGRTRRAGASKSGEGCRTSPRPALSAS